MAKFTRTRHTRTIRNLESAANSATSITEKAAVGLFRWMTTDHISNGSSIHFIPGTTFLGTLWNILVKLFFGILAAVLTGAIAFVMIAYGIPLLIDLMF